MKNSNKRTVAKQGSSFIAVMVLMVMAFGLASVSVRNSNHTARIINAEVEMERAHFLAEAALEHAATHISSINGFVPNTLTGAATEAEGGDWEYTVTKVAWREYEVAATGRFGNEEREIHIGRGRYPSFATYGFWTKDLREIWKIPGQIITGHFHSDSHIRIFAGADIGAPTFKGRVTTGQSEILGSPEFAVFEQGYELNSTQGDIATINFDEIEMEAIANGLRIEGPTEVRFDAIAGEATGYVDLKNPTHYGDSNWHRIALDTIDLIYVADDTLNGTDGTLQVQGGIINGRLSIYAEDDIELVGSVIYENDPTDDDDLVKDYTEDSDDALGMITKSDIWIADHAPDTDLYFDAAMIAVGVKDNGNIGTKTAWDEDRGMRGNVYYMGSQVTAQVGIHGYFNESGITISGYRPFHEYDKRFRSNPPPYYPPVNEKLIFEEWEYVRN